MIKRILASGSDATRRPEIGKGNESNVPGIHIIGDLAGAPVIKLAMAQGVEVIDYICEKDDLSRRSAAQKGADNGEVLDVLIVGAGAAGLNAALAAQEKGLRYLVLEKGKIANTVENFPEGKWVYAEPDTTPAKGKLWLDGARKEDLIARWKRIVADHHLTIHVNEGLEGAKRQSGGTFDVTTRRGDDTECHYRARRIVLATGQRGNPRKLGVAGEDLESVYHRLYSPRHYRDESIVVVGGGNSAIEAALVLAEANRVTLSYRKDSFSRLFKDNREKLEAAISAGRIKVLYRSRVKAFLDGEVQVLVEHSDQTKEKGKHEELTLPMDHAFVLIGAELPMKFLKKLGIRLENEWTGTPRAAIGLTGLLVLGLFLLGRNFVANAEAWTHSFALGGIFLVAASLSALIYRGIRGDRWSWLLLSFIIWYSIYGIKVGKGSEFWPYRGWGYQMLSFLGRPWAFWYTVLYTGLMTVFGLRALKRWGLERRDTVQIWRYTSLISFQWIFFFLVPEFLFQWAMDYQWLGAALASDPSFAAQAWRSYGIVYAWPLFFYTWFYDPHQIWIVWGIFLTFVILPIFVLFNGKRYCSWICGCGGLAETFGDKWRHLAPKGRTSIKLEWMGMAVLIFAAGTTALVLVKDIFGLAKSAEWSLYVYRIAVDVWMVGILPVTLYPFMGGKVWCRYWCPLAKLMQAMSALYVKLGISRFRIVANDKCIGCNECSRNCQVGIDVMSYALKQETLDNATSSCIGCGICVTVCPMDTLSYGREKSPQ